MVDMRREPVSPAMVAFAGPQTLNSRQRPAENTERRQGHLECIGSETYSDRNTGDVGQAHAGDQYLIACPKERGCREGCFVFNFRRCTD